MITYASPSNMFYDSLPLNNMFDDIRDAGVLEFQCQPGDGTNYHFLVVETNNRWLIVKINEHIPSIALSDVEDALEGNFWTVQLMREIIYVLNGGVQGTYYNWHEARPVQ